MEYRVRELLQELDKFVNGKGGLIDDAGFKQHGIAVFGDGPSFLDSIQYSPKRTLIEVRQ